MICCAKTNEIGWRQLGINIQYQTRRLSYGTVGLNKTEIRPNNSYTWRTHDM